MIFSSIGIADKEGNFPIKKFVEKSKTIDDYNLPAEDSIKKQFKLLEEYLPDFAKCQNSTTGILEGVLLNQKNLKFNRCVINRVYERSDKDKRPVLYVYIDLPDLGKKFYFADKNTQAFIELTQKKFEEKFECYEMDMKLYDGCKPWEYVKVVNNIEDLSKSSGEIGNLKGNARQYGYYKKIYQIFKKLFNKEDSVKMIDSPVVDTINIQKENKGKFIDSLKMKDIGDRNKKKT